MPARIHTGCCGWSYLNERDFAGEITGKFSSKLQAYAKLFDTVEINSTFYRLPRITTAEKWRKEADEIKQGFEFTVKAFKGITHLHRFRKKQSIDSFAILKDICSALRSRYILFQSPASYKPTAENIENMASFFDGIDRSDLIAVWEPRGTWYDEPGLIERVCAENNLVHCVDPFRNEPLAFGEFRTVYWRLHGFGKPTMYRYDFSDEELRKLGEKIDSIRAGARDAYVFFNNETCYRNGTSFRAMMT